MTAAELLRTRTWMLRTGLAVLALVLCGFAAFWQFERVRDQIAVTRAGLAEATGYEAVAPGPGGEIPLESLGRQVIVTGEPVLGLTALIDGRTAADGRVGALLVRGYRLPDGSLVAVQEGWTSSTAEDDPSGPVTVTGRLQPDENFYAAAPIVAGEPLITLTHRGLVAQWRAIEPTVDTLLRPGYVVNLDPAAGIEAVRPVIGSDPEAPFPLQNAFYSVQWIIFAGFVIVIWIRWLRADLAESRAVAAVVAEPAPN